MYDLNFYLIQLGLSSILAPQKVDFRELVRLLSREFRTRIELRQISNREYVGLNGAIGACGRQTCCSSFLTKHRKLMFGWLRINAYLKIHPN